MWLLKNCYNIKKEILLSNIDDVIDVALSIVLPTWVYEMISI